MPQMKLHVHQKNYSEESLVINQKAFPTLQIGDIVEIYLPEDEHSRLLLQVTSFRDDFQHKDTISVEDTLANAFHLPNYNDVCVNKVNIKDVALDSLELMFKDQYLGRSDMWRLKKSLTNTCVVANKKIKIFDIRCQVFEMWSHGERVSCGAVTEDTKIVYRSASSMFYLFIQMSSEMWDFDLGGDLYIEKALNGFLSDLFAKWKKISCNHDVTIVLFSRTYYKAQKIEEFPQYMHECLNQDYQGRFYEDYYRVAVQNERFEDWSNTLGLLKKLFLQYQSSVLEYHKRPEFGNLPEAYNSTAAEGNFLEVLNMSLNVFEKHYMDRSFDRTGQLSVVISPGVGVFEVDRELANITKQRTIDNGIGSDLVCLGEQPYHAVPLFKFHNKNPSSSNYPIGDDYNMPHWINLSFYSSPKQFTYSNFVPRIKLPSPLEIDDSKQPHEKSIYPSVPDTSFGIMFDYDEYDAQVFKCPTHTNRSSSSTGIKGNHPGGGRVRKRSTPPVVTYHRRLSGDLDSYSSPPPAMARSAETLSPSPAIAIPGASQSFNNRRVLSPATMSASLGSRILSDPELCSPPRSQISSSSPYETSGVRSAPVRKSRALINPFDPSRVTIKLTSNRRRWTHVFPLGPTGIFMQQHHYQAIPHNQSTLLPTEQILQSQPPIVIMPRKYRLPQDHPDMFAEITEWEQRAPHIPTSASSASLSSSVESSTRGGSRMTTRLGQNGKANLTWMWGVTGEQEWTPALTTGVDWKSLVIPACLPITTDYLPDEATFINSYVVSGDYTLVPEDIGSELTTHRCFRSAEEAKNHRPLNAQETFNELICQRLQQGFQIIILPKKSPQNIEEYWMSIGRIFHRLTLSVSSPDVGGPPDTISVTQYRPRHPYLPKKSYHYCYRFHAPDSPTYGVSWVDFTSELLENYRWNYLEHYICSRGDGSYELQDDLKYWRLRLLILPGVQTATRKIIEDQATKCDIYQPKFSQEDVLSLRENIIKLIEVINRIRRPTLSRAPSKFSSTTAKHSGSNTSLEGVQEGASSSSEDVSHLNQEAALRALSIRSSYTEVAEAMKHSTDGLFLVKQSGLPAFTFISFDAVLWLKDRLIGIDDENQAFKFLERMHSAGVICHASGNPNVPVIFGFYLYYLCSPSTKEGDKSPQSKQASEEDWRTFQKEWLQIEVPLAPSPVDDIDLPAERNELKWCYTNMEILDSVSSRSGERIEWGHIKYQNIFIPGEAFELNLQWMVATGNRVAELVQSWARKAGNWGLQLVPLPSDPFALPFSFKSDPLRGPIFIPLNLECLPEAAGLYLKDERLLLFQESILSRFGFLAHRDPQSRDGRQHYAHISGSMFILILQIGSSPSSESSSVRTPLATSQPTTPTASGEGIAGGTCEDYITRHYTRIKKSEFSAMTSGAEYKVGFLWAWNYMVTKRWKSQATGDENFMRKVMRDFRAFCANDEGRLLEFWSSLGQNSEVAACDEFLNLEV